VIPGFRFPGLGLPVPRESLLARTISMGWYCILRGESRWGVRVVLPPSLYRGMAIVQSSVNSEPIPCTCTTLSAWVSGLELARKSWSLYAGKCILKCGSTICLFYTTQCVFTSMNTGWVIHTYKTVNRRHSDNKENIDRSIVSYKTAVQYFNMLGCRHFKQRKTVFLFNADM
jgi:hypothetical protein